MNNPNLAQQLATGKVQVATVNGQQVLIRPTGNNQAQVIAQLTPGNLTPTPLQTSNQVVQTTPNRNLAPANNQNVTPQQPVSDFVCVTIFEQLFKSRLHRDYQIFGPSIK